ncbi:MAG TPA: DUF4129 domain-containing protein [Thermoanaerobaculia bacterium]
MTRSPRSSTERRAALALPALLLAGAVLLGAAPAGAAPAPAGPGDVQARAKQILSDPRYQPALPDHGKIRNPEDPGDDGPTFSSSGSGAPPVAVPVIGAGAALGKVLFIVLAVVVVLLIVMWIGRSVAARLGRRDEAASGETAPASTAPVERELQLDDAARLAAEGRYAEAVHALLLAAIRHFAERSRTPVQPSRTSRELVRLLPLGPDAREAFSDLVRMVELSLFGGASVSAEDYESSLARFRALTRRPA